VYASLKDVARRAGVSFQTVSKVVNGTGATVSERTRERIVAAARELGYVPNALARGLVRRTTYTIGIVTDSLDDWFLAEFVVGAQDEARRRHHDTLVDTRAPAGSARRAYARTLLEHRVDGIIAAAPSAEDDEESAAVLRGGLPAVAIHHVPGGDVPVVGSRHSSTGRLAADHLLALGHRRFGAVIGPRTRRVVRTRLRGFRSALDEAGVALPDSAIVESDWTSESGYAATRALLRRHPELTALHVHSDVMATGALAALHDLGRRVPADCSVVSCDNLAFSAYLRPPLTTVTVPARETGERAMRILLDLVARARPTDATLLPVELVVRQSCAHPPAA